ncbi:MAG: cyclase family protein [Polyangiaceae bacterium]
MKTRSPFSRVVDLSHVIDTDICPGDPAVELIPVATLDADGYYLRSFTIGEHSGTHMNAPSSFFEGGAGIDAGGPEQRVVSAVVIDIRHKTQAGPDYALKKQDVLAWEQDRAGRRARGRCRRRR